MDQFEQITQLIKDLKIEKLMYYNDPEVLDQIPNKPGVYYFYSFNNELFYVGRAKSLKYRIRSHQKLNNLVREGKFLSSFLKNNPKLEEENDEFRHCMADFTIRCMENGTPCDIDIDFHNVHHIVIEELPYEFIGYREQVMIYDLKPLYNRETRACSKYETSYD